MYLVYDGLVSPADHTFSHPLDTSDYELEVKCSS